MNVMKVLVPVKRVVSPYVKIRVKNDSSDVDIERAKMVMNPFDEIAVEEAVRLKEQGLVTEIIGVSIGDTASQEVLRNGLAIGMDRAILVEHGESLEPLNIAKILRVLVEQEQAQLVIMGKQSIDGDNNQTGQMLAALLDWPQATFASSITIEGDAMTVVREVDGGLETLALQLPAVVTTDLRLNEPRYPTLPNIMKAKKKPLQIKTPTELGVTAEPHTTVVAVNSPPQRPAGQIVASVDELIEKLSAEAKVI